MKYTTLSSNKQLTLFEPKSSYQVSRQPSLVMSKSYLEQWKERIYRYQQQKREEKIEQIPLLESYNLDWNIDNFDPFSLTTHPDQFYDLPQYQNSESCLYFILDIDLPLLLYVGETKRSPKERWSEHDCKNYLQQYIDLHRQYSLSTTIRSAFWWGITKERKLRQRLEKELILKWRSPFNKESWVYWGQPFKAPE
jgi:hypothetical protein